MVHKSTVSSAWVRTDQVSSLRMDMAFNHIKKKMPVYS